MPTAVRWRQNALDRARTLVSAWQSRSLLEMLPYRGEASYADLIGEMTWRGFQLMSVEPAFGDPRSGQLLAVDGIFSRS